MKKTLALLLAALMIAATLFLPSCSTTPKDESEAGANLEKKATEITLNGSGATFDSSSVYVGEDGKISINSAGTYLITGTLDDGMIYVDCVDAGIINLVLKGASITNNDGACIYIRKTQNAVITLYEGTTNTLTDGASYKFENPEDTEPDAALFSKEDLTINGTGSLVVNGNYSNGIVSKDGLKIDNGNITVSSARHGIKGKDYLVINGGTLTVNALRDGIKSTNYDSQLVGYVEINGGTVNITSEDEAVQAVSAINFNGGEVTLGSTNNGVKCDGTINFNGGSVAIDVEDNALNGFAINKREACTVTISGVPYNG
ncbi:MAG: carbohydrate-binding domain-containing protein [Clostridia bacterium]|nr:carbohydrate-binding domain-containing protein [Clostridia bacterium]